MKKTKVDELNFELYKECIKDNVNYDVVKDLLNKGADPWREINHNLMNGRVLSKIIYERSYDYDNDDTMCKLFKIFLDNGMVVRDDSVDESDDSYNPLEFLWGVKAKKAIKIFELLIKHNTGIKVFENYLNEVNCYMIGECHRELSEEVRKIMYLVSYKELRENCPILKVLLHYEENDKKYDLSKFRRPFDYDIFYDMTDEYGLDTGGLVIYICEKETGKKIWEFVREVEDL